MALFATDKEVEAFTGCKTPGAQILMLMECNVRHFIRHDNKPVVAKTVLDESEPHKGHNTIVPTNAAIDELAEMPRNGIGIYFLCHKSKIVYVGKTTNFFGRISAHNGGEYEFDSVKFLPASIDRLDALEREYIARYQPKYNKMHNVKPIASPA